MSKRSRTTSENMSAALGLHPGPIATGTTPVDDLERARTPRVEADPVRFVPDESESWAVTKRVTNASGQAIYDLVGPRDLTAKAAASEARAWIKFTSTVKLPGFAAAEACRLAAEAFEYRGEVPTSDVRVDLRDTERLAEVVLEGEDGVAVAMAYFGI